MMKSPSERKKTGFDNTKNKRKWILPLILLITLKGFFLGVVIFNGRIDSASDFICHEVSAQEAGTQEPQAADLARKSFPLDSTQKPSHDIVRTWDVELVNALQEREAEVKRREEEIKKEEERLQSIKIDIENRIENLTQIQLKIASLVQSKQALENEKITQLAKVFESTPPEQAGPMITKLDIDIAAKIVIKMNGRKAGKIWGYVDPDRAVAISKEIARLQNQ